MYANFGLFINGRWLTGTVTGEVVSPVTGAVLGEVAVATANETRDAIDAAAAALPKLRAMGGFARAEALHRAADEMLRRAEEGAKMISLETGKPIA
ncbi:MAG TPA: NAD-dependent succinate-semialdehyde dehydrogenase, partial [Agrobacterium sp.]|nr:NAD-dependent succinate-semialdehyde dehydrogenase [Agrobacterium sp.]